MMMMNVVRSEFMKWQQFVVLPVQDYFTISYIQESLALGYSFRKFKANGCTHISFVNNSETDAKAAILSLQFVLLLFMFCVVLYEKKCHSSNHIGAVIVATSMLRT